MKKVEETKTEKDMRILRSEVIETFAKMQSSAQDLLFAWWKHIRSSISAK